MFLSAVRRWSLRLYCKRFFNVKMEDVSLLCNDGETNWSGTVGMTSRGMFSKCWWRWMNSCCIGVLAGVVMQLASRLSDVILATDVSRGLVQNKRALVDTRGLAGLAPAAVVWLGGGVTLASSLMVRPRLLVRRARMLCLLSSCLVWLLNLSSMNGMLKVKIAARWNRSLTGLMLYRVSYGDRSIQTLVKPTFPPSQRCWATISCRAYWIVAQHLSEGGKVGLTAVWIDLSPYETDMINCNAVHEPRRAFCHHFLLPNRYNMLIGVTGCGKSNALSDMLQWMCPDWVATYTIHRIKKSIRC